MNHKDIIATKVVEYYSNYPNLMRDDILHTQEVVTFTRIIAVGEGLPDATVDMLESAAWLHDIGCPNSKEIYGNSLPVNQQSVGKVVSEQLVADIVELTKSEKEWLVSVVASHHQFAEAKQLQFLPLFEADLIVNLLSGYHPRNKAELLYNSLMTTKTGKQLFKTLIK